MEALRIENLTKKYQGFALDNVTFSLPKGSIMGFIGENGAGKTTTIKAMFEMIKRDSGKIFFLGKEYSEKDKSLKEHIGIVMDGVCFAEELNAKEVNKCLKKIYKTWKEETFFEWLKRLSLKPEQIIKEYSRGMTMKLSLAAALSHDTKVLVLDEATSGLDPVVREQMLDVFMEFIQDEEHSILMSSHILSDLEKICDYITFIHDGKILFSMEKDELLEKYQIVKGNESELAVLEEEAVIGKRKNAFGMSALVETDRIPDGMVKEKAGIEDIMLYYVQEGC